MPRLWVLLPCLNEEAALPGLLSPLRKLPTQLREAEPPPADIPEVRILVIDDGSTDGTAGIAHRASEDATAQSECSIALLQHAGNLGLGAAIRTGILRFIERADESDWLATMDGDGTQPPELLVRMLREAHERRLDVVIASRYAGGGGEAGVSPSRRLYSRICSRGLRMLFRIQGVRDYTCGFRVYSGKALTRAHAQYGASLIRERGFACQAELLLHLACSGAVIGEVPLVLRYDEKRGASKMRVLPTIWRYTVLTARELGSRRRQPTRGNRR